MGLSPDSKASRSVKQLNMAGTKRPKGFCGLGGAAEPLLDSAQIVSLIQGMGLGGDSPKIVSLALSRVLVGALFLAVLFVPGP
jgi:hypothetical protein